MAIDACIFHDEIDLLELRLGQLDDVVDHFVIVESNRTFTGRPKPLHLRDNMSRFEKYAAKIVRVEMPGLQTGPWEAERRHRDAVLDGINRLNRNPNETLTFSDLDEIPNPEVIKAYTPDLGLRNLLQFTFYYNFNHMMNYGGRSWSRARIGTIQDINQFKPDGFRGGPRDMDSTFPSLENGGWHCSYFGSLARIRNKVNSFAHDDMAPIIQRLTDAELSERVLGGKDLFGRQGIGDGWWWDSNDPRLPSYFLANQEKFKMFLNENFNG